MSVSPCCHFLLYIPSLPPSIPLSTPITFCSYFFLPRLRRARCFSLFSRVYPDLSQCAWYASGSRRFSDSSSDILTFMNHPSPIGSSLSKPGVSVKVWKWYREPWGDGNSGCQSKYKIQEENTAVNRQTSETPPADKRKQKSSHTGTKTNTKHIVYTYKPANNQANREKKEKKQLQTQTIKSYY